MRHRIFIITLLFFYFFTFHITEAQEKNKSADNDIKITTLMVGADYSSNTNTFGKFDTVSQPSLTPNIGFYHKSGLFVSSLFNFVGNSDSSYSKTTMQFNLKGGYQFKIGDKFSITPSYTLYFYDNKALTINTLYENYAEVYFDYQHKYWFASVSPGYLWGRIDEFTVDTRAGASYTWENLLAKDDALSIQFIVSAYFNNPNYLAKLFSFLQNYAEKNPDDTRYDLIRKLLTNYQGNPPSEISEIRRTFRNDPTLRLLVGSYLPYGISVYDFLNYNNRFTLTSLAFSLPVTYMIGDFTFNIDLSVYKSVNQPVYSEQNQYYSYLTAGITYSINW